MGWAQRRQLLRIVVGFSGFSLGQRLAGLRAFVRAWGAGASSAPVAAVVPARAGQGRAP